MTGRPVAAAIAVLGVVSLQACGAQDRGVMSPFGAEAALQTWAVPGDLRESADTLVATDEGLLLAGHDQSGLILSLRNPDSAQWSPTTHIAEGYGWQAADSMVGPVAVGAICKKPSVDMDCGPDGLRLRAYRISAQGNGSPIDGPELSGVTADGVDLQVAAVGESIVVAVRSAVDTSTLFMLEDAVWGEIGTTEPVRRMCSTAGTLYIQSFVFSESPDVAVEQMPMPSKSPPTDPVGNSVPVAVGDPPSMSVPVGGQPIPDSMAIPLVMREFAGGRLSKAASIGSTVDGSRDGEIACDRERAEVMIGGNWEPLSAQPMITGADPGNSAQTVLVGGETGQMPGYLDVADNGEVVARFLDGIPIEVPSKLDPAGSIVAAAHGNDSMSLLVARASNDGLKSESDPKASRLVVVAQDR